MTVNETLSGILNVHSEIEREEIARNDANQIGSENSTIFLIPEEAR